MKIDLNLFRVFDVLMELRSVSRSAARLGVTQSAVSHALARLREQLGDPLFVRTGGALRPTERAREIAPAIREGLSLLRDATSASAFDPGSTTRAFTLCAGTYFCVTLLPQVIERARAEAPNAQFRVVPPGDDSFSGLDEGAIDIALGSADRYPQRFANQPLYRERLVWVARAGTEAGELADRPRIAMASPQRLSEDVLVRGSLERVGTRTFETYPAGPSVLTLHDPLSAGAIVATSDLVTQLPSQLAHRASGRAPIAVIAAEDATEIELAMIWHPRLTDDPSHIWLRGLFGEAAARLSSSTP